MAKSKASPAQTFVNTVADMGFAYVDPRSLVMNDQVRSSMDEGGLLELQESIRQHGVKTPIQVRKVGKAYHVIAGHRRTVAAIGAELATVPVVIQETEEEDIPAVQLIENLQREDMSLADISKTCWRLYEGRCAGSAQALAALIGKRKAWVSKILTIGREGLETSNTVVRSLMARDLLPDMELGYLICQLEKLDKPAAQAVGEDLASEDPKTTRKSLAAAIKRAKDANPEADGGDGEPGDDNGDGEPTNPADTGPTFSRDMLVFIRKTIEAATVNPADLSKKSAALKALQAAIEAE